MGKIKDWKLIDEVKREVRRPNGYRSVNQKTYNNNDGKNILVLVTMPRRPMFTPYGSVKLNNKLLFEGSKKEAEQFAYNFMENNTTKKDKTITIKDLTKDNSFNFIYDGFKVIDDKTAFENSNEEPELTKKLKRFSKSKSRSNESIFDDVIDFAEKQGWKYLDDESDNTYNHETPLVNNFEIRVFYDKDEYYFVYLKHIGQDIRVGYEIYTITSSDYEYDEDFVTYGMSEDAVDYTYNDLNKNGFIEVIEYESGSVFNGKIYNDGIYYKYNGKVVKVGNLEKPESITYITKKVYNVLSKQDKEKFTEII